MKTKRVEFLGTCGMCYGYMTVLCNIFPAEEITKSWGTGSVLPCWFSAGFRTNNEQWQSRGTIDYHIVSSQSWKWVGAEFPSEFLRTKIGIVHVIQMEVSWVMEVTPNHSLRMGQWKPPDLKHQNSETGGLFLGARFQRHNRRSGNAEPPLCHGNEEETPEVWVFTLADHFDIKGW